MTRQCVVYKNQQPHLLFTDSEDAIARNLTLIGEGADDYAWRLLDAPVSFLKEAPAYDPAEVTCL